MRSVTEQLEAMHTADENLQSPDGAQFEEDHLGVTPAEPVSENVNADNMQRIANAKLKLAFATRTVQPKPTGVHFKSSDQTQMIYDDGSVRNPYKVNRVMSGRQRRKMRKETNRVMKARGLQGRIEDVLKGRNVGTLVRPLPETPESPVPAASDTLPSGTPVAAVFGD